MKKICLSVMVAAMLAACDNPLEYKPASMADELVLNGHLYADEQWHTVYVAVSHTEYSGRVFSGELRCYVNGRLEARTTELNIIDEDDSYAVPSCSFSFKASFKAGDVVRIEVDADGFKASCEQVVPQKPDVSRVDTVSVRHRIDYDEVDDCYRFDVTLKDSDPEDSFFRLVIADYAESVFYKDGEQIGTDNSAHLRTFWADDDPILNEGHFNANEVFEIGSTNYFGVVTDNMFAGASATLRPIVDKRSFGMMRYMEGADSVEISAYALVKVHGISKPYYYYLKALNMLRDGSTDLALEDVQIPDNIDGGIGFIGIANPTTTSFFLGKEAYSLLYY